MASIGASQRLVDWLNAGLSEPLWAAVPAIEGGYHVTMADRGVTDHYIVDPAFLGSAEARKLHTLAGEQADTWATPARLAGVTVRRPSELLAAIMEGGRKGLAIARYKGLGEMNAEQLWGDDARPRQPFAAPRRHRAGRLGR